MKIGYSVYTENGIKYFGSGYDKASAIKILRDNHYKIYAIEKVERNMGQRVIIGMTGNKILKDFCGREFSFKNIKGEKE